jgi:hypothetical protein
MSENTTLHVCAEEKPELYLDVHLYFEDEHEATGHWTGRYWWTQDHEAVPLYWQNIEPHWKGGGHPSLHSFRN